MIKVPSVKKIEYLAKGKRSIVYQGIYKNKKVAIKVKNPSSEAKNRIKNEVKFLKLVNKYYIGPKLILSKNNYLVYELAEGISLVDYIKTENKRNISKVIIELLNQARVLDKLKINKLEFTRPIKHVFISDKVIIIIDFERCYSTENPKNVTQFCQFLLKEKLIKNKTKVFKEYKKNQSDKSFIEILKLVKL